MTDISVIIPTYNREKYLSRCLGSILKSKKYFDEIIIIDDASTDGTEQHIRENYPECRYFKMDENRGPCVARNHGLSVCSTEYAIMIDSDDELVENCMDEVVSAINNTDFRKYPVCYFLTDNAGLAKTDIGVLTDIDLISKTLTGDVCEIINVKEFLIRNYKYPDTGAGGEHLLWLEIAQKDGIPVYNKTIIKVNHDADNRLTSAEEQMKRAVKNANLQELTLKKFGQLYLENDPLDYQKRLNACSVYWKLAGDTAKSREWAVKSLRLKKTPENFMCYLYTYLPVKLAQMIFIKWRKI